MLNIRLFFLSIYSITVKAYNIELYSKKAIVVIYKRIIKVILEALSNK